MLFYSNYIDILTQQAFKYTIMDYPINQSWSINRKMVLCIPRMDARLLPPGCTNINGIKHFVTQQIARDIGHVGDIKIDKTCEYMCFTLVIYIDGWYTTGVAVELQRTIRAQRSKASIEYHPDARNRWFWIVEEKCDKPDVNTDPDDVGAELMCADGESDKCAICLAEQHKHTYTRLDCGHCFHKTCIKSWFDRSTTCPTCRQ